MQRGKSNPGVKTESTNLKVVTVETNPAQIELEIEKHIRKIRTLINKLRPAERQKYFNGLLSHILDEPVETTHSQTRRINSDTDHSALSHEELMLIEELSIKMEQLYRTMDHDPS
jgi:hypothetical protein